MSTFHADITKKQWTTPGALNTRTRQHLSSESVTASFPGYDEASVVPSLSVDSWFRRPTTISRYGGPALLKGKVYLKPKYCWRSDWDRSSESPKFMIWQLHSDHFPLRNGYVPLQKIDVFGPELTPKNVTLVIYWPDSDGVFTCVNPTFLVTRLYP